MTVTQFLKRKMRMGRPWERERQLVADFVLYPGLGVKLSTIILAGPTVLSAVGGALRMMA
jgi:hypothetical protein